MVYIGGQDRLPDLLKVCQEVEELPDSLVHPAGQPSLGAGARHPRVAERRDDAVPLDTHTLCQRKNIYRHCVEFKTALVLACT